MSLDVFGANSPYGPKPNQQGPTPQEYQKKINDLKIRRDADVAALVKQRDAQVLALQNQMKQLVQNDIALINKDKARLEQRMNRGEDMKRNLQILRQQEQTVIMKANALQQQIGKLTAAYGQQIETITRSYAKLFSDLQQQMMTQGAAR